MYIVGVCESGVDIFEYNQRLYSLGGLTGNDRHFEHSICASRGHATSKRH